MKNFSHAIVTGGAGGLGRAVAARLAGPEKTLILVDSDTTALADVAQQLAKKGASVVTVGGDVTDAATWADVVGSVERGGIPLDLLANCAGVSAASGIDEGGIDLWRWAMDVNFFGTVMACAALAPVFKRQRRGHVLNVASRAGISSAPKMGAYNASKAAVISLSETLYNELNDYGVGVTVACPSYFNSGIARAMRVADERYRSLASRFIESSPVSADDMAGQVLAAAEAGILHYFPPGEDRRLWWLKRMAPRACLDLVRRKYRSAAGEA